jgi:diguanylate cyclase (GGDEF)-like protein
VGRSGRRRDAVSELLKLTRVLTQETSLESALRAVTDVALGLVPADHASIRLLDGAKTSFLSGARSGKGSQERPMAFRRNQGVLGWVVEHRAPLSLEDAAKDPRFVSGDKQGFKVRSIVAEPLWAGGDVIGVLSVSSSRRAAFSDKDALLVRLLANCSVSPIENARLRRLAIVDDLTLAYNHRFLLPRVREEMERSRRMGTPLSFALLDLDHFKRVNDKHGHLVGDLVLQRFADRVRINVRRIDVLVRRSGEEFVLLMPSTSAKEGRLIAERIQQTLAATPLEVEGPGEVRQTVSIGVATWDGQEAPDMLERRADHAMYAAKRGGRNQVVVAEPVVWPKPQPKRGAPNRVTAASPKKRAKR